MGWANVIAAAAATIGISSVAATAEAREPRRLSPSSKWVVDYADDMCRLARNFGKGDETVMLIMDQFAPGDAFKLSLVGKSVQPRRSFRPFIGTIRFGPNEAEDEVTGVKGTMGDLPLFMVDGASAIAPRTDAQEKAAKEASRQGLPEQVPPLGAERERAATWLQIGKLFRSDLILETGPMDRPMEALRTCSWDMVRSWGLDVDQQKGLSRNAVPQRALSSYFSAKDYPKDMLQGGFESNVHVRLMVDERGQPTSCHIQHSTRPQDFDDKVCAILMQVRFNPALDANGTPVRSYYRQSVNFRLSDAI